MFRKAFVVIAILAAVGGAVASSEAMVMSYITTSTDSGPGAGITYSLTYELVGGSVYHAEFSVTAPATLSTLPDWYAAWFLFKFDGSTASTLSPPEVPAGSGPWSVSDPTQNASVLVLTGGGHYGKLLPLGGFSGFYVTSIAEGSPADDPKQGVLLTPDSPTTYTFGFDFAVPDGRLPLGDLMPFQVGYYKEKGNNKGYEVNQLSSVLATPVPEPTSLFLLGTGLIGVGILGRRFGRRP